MEFYKRTIILKEEVQSLSKYHINIEIKNELTPEVWTKKEI